jgi:hypothetical protein
MHPFFVEFEIGNAERFAALSRVFAALKHDKAAGAFRSVEAWKAFFDAQALSHFWWPSPTELEDWKRRYLATPYPQRFSEPSLKRPWDFASLIEAFQNGDYELLGLSQIEGGLARLDFAPYGHPFGGTGCMRALIEAFDHRVTVDSETDE